VIKATSINSEDHAHTRCGKLIKKRRLLFCFHHNLLCSRMPFDDGSVCFLLLYIEVAALHEFCLHFFPPSSWLTLSSCTLLAAEATFSRSNAFYRSWCRPKNALPHSAHWWQDVRFVLYIQVLSFAASWRNTSLIRPSRISLKNLDLFQQRLTAVPLWGAVGVLVILRVTLALGVVHSTLCGVWHWKFACACMCSEQSFTIQSRSTCENGIWRILTKTKAHQAEFGSKHGIWGVLAHPLEVLALVSPSLDGVKDSPSWYQEDNVYAFLKSYSQCVVKSFSMSGSTEIERLRLLQTQSSTSLSSPSLCWNFSCQRTLDEQRDKICIIWYTWFVITPQVI